MESKFAETLFPANHWLQSDVRHDPRIALSQVVGKLRTGWESGDAVTKKVCGTVPQTKFS